jgi:hypothetical protein
MFTSLVSVCLLKWVVYGSRGRVPSLILKGIEASSFNLFTFLRVFTNLSLFNIGKYFFIKYYYFLNAKNKLVNINIEDTKINCNKYSEKLLGSA